VSRTASTSKHPARNDAGWALITLILAGVCLAEIWKPLPVEPSGFVNLGIALTALVSAAIFYRTVRQRENFSVMCIALSQVLLFSAFGEILSYLLAREGGALWDSTFASWDKALGFDWYATIRWVDAHPLAAAPLTVAYASLIPQVIVLILALGFANRLNELRIFMLAAMTCGTLTILLSPLFPALNQFAYDHIGPAAFPRLNVADGYRELRDLEALRSGSIAVLRLRDLQGIIAFPSYHAGLAAITLWGFRKSGIKWIAWPGAILALTTILSTPVDGGHYLVDVIAGLTLAGCSLALAQRAIFWRIRLIPIKASPFRRSHAALAR
jgi:hypothetical protein